MAVVINTSQNVVTVSQDGPTTVVVQDVGIQGPRGAAGSGSFANSSALATTGSNSFIGNQSINGDVAVTGSLTVSGSNTFRVIGPTILQGAVTIVSGSLTATVVSASYATTASYALNAGVTVNTGSLIRTASLAGTTLTFTKGDASTFNLTLPTSGGGTGSGAYFTNATVIAGATGTTLYTLSDGTTLTTSYGSGYQLVDGVPNVEVLARPNKYFTNRYSAMNPTTVNQYHVQPVNGSNWSYIWWYVEDRETTGWASVQSGSVLRFKESGSSANWAYYGVTEVFTPGALYYWERRGAAIKLANSPDFTAAATASIELFASAPNPVYQPASYSTAYYVYTKFVNQNIGISNFGYGPNNLALISGSTLVGTSPTKRYLYAGSLPQSGSMHSMTTGQYVGFSTDNSSWTYYLVLGEIFTYNNTYVTVEPVDGDFYVSANTPVYVKVFNRIPSQPYYRSLSHITHPITPSGTSSPSGSIGDVSYDDSYFYVKTSAGWKRAALSTW